MSRYSFKMKDGCTVAYGFDRVTKWFFQVFDNTKEEVLLVDESYLETGLTHLKLYDLMVVYKVEDKDHLQYALWDVAF